MATGLMNGVIRHLYRTVLPREGGPTDRQLLECFVVRRDDAAFAALVRRHGPMVLGVCQRVLQDAHDAEDAFQATFLVLVRKAASLARGDLLGPWLYGVAYRTALKARTMTARRRAKERQACGMPGPESGEEDTQRDLLPLLDQELRGLPEKYRVLIVLCYLEGRGKQEMARRLGLPEGTVSSRLARAREMLRRRLARRGLAVTGAALAAALVPGAVSAAVPAPLISSTIRAATLFGAGEATAGAVSAAVVALTEGVLKAMLLTKLKIATAVLLAVGIVTAGAGVSLQPAQAEPVADKPATVQKEEPAKKAEPPAKKGEPEPKKEPTRTGVVHSVDAAKGTITVTFAKLDAKSQRTFDLAKDAKVFVDGQEAQLGDLKPGFPVTLRLAEDQKAALRISVQGPTLTGELKAVDAAKGTIVVTVKTSGGDQDKTLEVAKDVQVIISGRKEAKLADLKAGPSASVTLSADKSKVIAIATPAKNVEPPKKDGEE